MEDLRVYRGKAPNTVISDSDDTNQITSYEYNENGDTTRKEIWNGDNQVTLLTASEYSYNTEGRVVRMTVDQGGFVTETAFTYDSTGKPLLDSVFIQNQRLSGTVLL